MTAHYQQLYLQTYIERAQKTGLCAPPVRTTLTAHARTVPPHWESAPDQDATLDTVTPVAVAAIPPNSLFISSI